MEPHAILDFVIFQLTPTRTRCELYVVAGNETEKLASGLFKPFLSHLQSVEEQLAKGAYSICLQPPCNGSDISWFTKGTVERFVSFVSNPEVLERVNSTEVELRQLEETVRMQTRNLSEVNDAPTIFSSCAPPGGQDMPSVRVEKDVHLIQMKQDPLNEIETLVKENSRKRLLNAVDARRMFLQKEQGMCFVRAAAAGFDSRQLMELIMFSNCFKARRLREACTKFMDLYMKRQESGLSMQDMDSLASFFSRQPFTNVKSCKEELQTSDAACDPTERGKHHESILNDKANIDASEDLFVINGRRWQALHDLEDFHGGIVQNTRTDQCILGMIGQSIEEQKFDQDLENHGGKEILPVQCTSVEANTVAKSEPFRRWRKASPLRNGQISPGCAGQLSELVENSIDEPPVFPGSSSKDEKRRVEPARLRVRDVIGMFEQKCHQVHSSEVGLSASQDRVKTLTHPKPRKKVLEKWSVIRDESNQKTNEEDAELDLKNEAEFTKEVIILGDEQKDDLRKSTNRRQYDGAESVGPCPQMGSHHLDNIMVSNDMNECPQEPANLTKLYVDHGVEERVLEMSNELRLPYLSDLHGAKPGRQLAFTEYFCSYSEHKTRQDSDRQLLSQDWPTEHAGGNDILCGKLSECEVRSSTESSVVASQPLPATNCSVSERVPPNLEEKAEYKEKLAVITKDKQKRADHHNSPSLETISTKFESSDIEAHACTAFSEVSTSNDCLTAPKQAEERVKRFLDQYHEKREAKRKDVSRSKIPGKLLKSKDDKEVLEKKKGELGKSHKVERSNLLAEAHLRAEKLRAYKADLQRSRKEKEEEERRRLEELKERRRERAAARRSASPLSTLSTLSSPQWHRMTLLPPGPSPPNKWSPRSQKAIFSGKSPTPDQPLSKPLSRKSNEIDGSHPCRVNRRSENLSKSASSAIENVKKAGRNPSLHGSKECKNGLQSKSPNQLVSPPSSKKNSTSTSNITAKKTVSLSQTSASRKVIPPLDISKRQGLSGKRGGNDLPVSTRELKHVAASKKDIKQSINRGREAENGTQRANNSNSYKSSTHLNPSGSAETRPLKSSQAVPKNTTSDQLGYMESIINGELSSDGGHSRLDVHDFSFHKEGRDFEEAQPARGVQEFPLTGEFDFQDIENCQQPVGFVFPSFVKGQHLENYPSANMECETPNSGVLTLENMYFSASPIKASSSMPFEDNYKHGVPSSPAGESVLSELSALRTPCATRSPSFAVSFDVSVGVSDACRSPLYHDQSPSSAPVSTSQNVYINVSGGSGDLNIPMRRFQEPRAKWGNSEYVSFLDMNSPSNNQGKDLKRILKFGRRTTNSSKQRSTDQVSASTTSEGDEAWGNLTEPGANIVDCYGRKKHSNGKIFNLRASTNEIHYYSASLSGSDGIRVPLKRSVSVQEVNSKSQDQNNLKTAAGKTSRSFFSLARFRKKTTEGRSR